MSKSAIVHFKGLNGIRAIAALSVVVHHISRELYYYDLAILHGIDLAGYGVTMFFSLSGFLITYILLTEKREFGDVSIRSFYVRRILRIWPIYYLYLAIAIVTIIFFNVYRLPGSIGYYIFLFANIAFFTGNFIPLLGHYWSLAVEEQFYIFWPWIVKRKEKLLQWVIVFIIFMLLLKFIGWLILRQTGNELFFYAVHYTRFHCMAIGAIGAILLFNNNKRFITAAMSIPLQIVSWGVIILMACNQFNVMQVINDEIVAVITVFLIVNVSRNPRSIIKLNNKIMDWLGKISYGIYVYHPLFVFLTGKLLGDYIKTINTPYRYIVIYVFVTGVSIVAAGASYHFFEKRFILLKNKFTRVHSLPA